MSLEDKAARVLADACADSRFNEVALAHRMGAQVYDIQARFYNVLVSFIYYHAHNYEYGVFPNGTYEIARMCKKIKDLAYSDEYSRKRYEVYGDYEQERRYENLTLFDIA